jgi:hypothetical protein
VSLGGWNRANVTVKTVQMARFLEITENDTVSDFVRVTRRDERLGNGRHGD